MWRAVGLVVLSVLAASCGVGSGSLNARPADLWSVMPSQAAVRSLMGDSNWYAGPPSFEVEPLDASTTPATHKFGITQLYEHLGSGETLVARYVVYDKTSSATTAMTDFQNLFGQSISTSPKVGDQVLYYATFAGGGAPYLTRTFVRVGQVVLELIWTKKDAQITVSQMGKYAKAFSDPIRTLNGKHVQLTKVDDHLLPPPGLDITALGSANLPLDSFVVMISSGLPGSLLTDLQSAGGASSFAYGDYALNLDTHMEVQTAAIQFRSATAAASFATLFSPNPPDQSGIGSGYIPSGGTPAAGQYHYVFSQGSYGILIICKPSIDGEAASRECEDPLQKTALAWKAALANAGA